MRFSEQNMNDAPTAVPKCLRALGILALICPFYVTGAAVEDAHYDVASSYRAFIGLQ